MHNKCKTSYYNMLNYVKNNTLKNATLFFKPYWVKKEWLTKAKIKKHPYLIQQWVVPL